MRQISKLGYIISRNFKMLIRSKLSALIFFFGPLIVLLLVGLAFNTSLLHELNIAVYSEEYSPLSEELISSLNESGYSLIKMESDEACLEAVKFRNYQGCIVFPKMMALDNSANNKVVIKVDNTRLNIANLLASQLVSAVSLESDEVSTQSISQILNVLDNANQNAVQAEGYMGELKSSNEQISSSAGLISSSAGSIDLDYSAIDTSAIDTEISNIQSDYNLSSSAFSSLNSLVNNLKDAYNNLASKASSATNEIVEISADIGKISSYSSADKGRIDSVNSKLDNIVNEIASIKITNVENIIAPIKTQIEPLSAKSSYLLFIWPFLLVLLIMFGCLLLSSTMVISEKTSTAHFRNFITPTSDSLFVFGNFLSLLLIAVLQIALIVGIGYMLLGGLLKGANIMFIAVLLLLAALFVCLGMILGYLFRTKQTVIVAALSLGLALLFFSNSIVPLEIISGLLRTIASYNPFVLGEGLLKAFMIFGAELSHVALQFYLLLGITIVCLVLVLITERARRKNR